MTTIGTAVLQIIPSLRGVTEAIESQIDGKAVDIQIKPKVDQRATEAAAKQARETVEKQTTEVKVQPKVDKRAAERAGKTAGEAVTKGATDAVEQSSTGKDIAKVLVDGIADGVKDELRGGPLVDEFVDGLADGVKQGIDQGGVSKTIITSINDGLKSGNLTGSIKDAVLPGIRGIGTDLQLGARDWAAGIAGSLRSGDIQGATDEIGNTVRSTTDVIANIGETFGLQLGGVREFGEQAATSLSGVAGDVQGVVDTALNLKGTFNDVGNILETVLPGKAGKGAASITKALSAIAWPAALLWLMNQTDDSVNTELEKRGLPVAPTDRSRSGNAALPLLPGDPLGINKKPPAIPKGGPFGTGNGPHGRGPVKDPTGGLLSPGAAPSAGGNANDLLEKLIPGRSSGGYTGNLPVDQVAGVVHGKEYVLKAISQERIENDHPGLLDHMNATGKLPGYAGGGLVAGTSELRKIIGQRFGISNIGGYRPGGDGFNEHSTGRALDVMVGSNRAKGDAVKDFALANASAIDLKWVIWRQHLYYPGGGGYDMEDRGNPTQNHMDHVHIFSGTGIANGLRGALKGQQTQQQRPTTAAGPGVIDPASTDATGASVADVAPATSEGSDPGGFSVPSSLSGLSTFWLDKLGVTTSTQIGSGSQERTFDIGSAVSSAVGGQVSSALGVFGVGDSPGWLQGISKFVGGISVSDKNGKKVFDGGNIGGTFGDAGSLFGGAAPTPPPAPAALPGGAVHGGQAGGAPGPVFNTTISAFDTTDAVTMWDRKKNEIVASKIGHI